MSSPANDGQLHRLDRSLETRVRGDDHDADAGLALEERRQRRQARFVAQPEVQEDDVEDAPLYRVERRAGGADPERTRPLFGGLPNRRL